MQFASICEDVVSKFILVPLICKELPLNKGLNALRQFVEIGRNFFPLFLLFVRSSGKTITSSFARDVPERSVEQPAQKCYAI